LLLKSPLGLEKKRSSCHDKEPVALFPLTARSKNKCHGDP
jgi:hypothetical protein